jgi:dTDP-3-amino-3,4,6-trideoxy-alpha-D-glucose transaminase
VALPANTFFATFEAIVTAGHIPVVVDHDDDLLLSATTLADLEVDAVVPVHLYGLPVDMTGLMAEAGERGWWVLEDASQAHGAAVGGRPVGSLGHAAAFSAYPTKNLGAWGDAGFVTGSDPRIETLLRSLRHHGDGGPGRHLLVGGTHRMDSIQALVLTEKLTRLPEEVRRRREVAAWYREALDGVGLDLPGDRGDRSHAYHQFVVRVPRRDEVRARLAGQGIQTAVHYPVPVHRQPAARGRCLVPRVPRRAEKSAAEVLSLPMRPDLRPGDVERVAAGLRAALRAVRHR